MANMNSPKPSFYAFMSRIIDYAGLYPPASLPLEEAFRNFIHYQDDPDAWMLSRFVLPARRLAELSALMPEDDSHYSFTLLGRGGKDSDEFSSNLKLDLHDIQAFSSTYGSRVSADMFEVPLYIPAFEDQYILNGLVKQTAEFLNSKGLTVFFEAPFGDGWQERADKLFYALRKVKDKHVGFKLRTGGVTADAFPSTEQVARAILVARDSGIPLKCTAGLHHPIRHFNESVRTKMHGFLNVFGAGVLAAANGISQDLVQSILEDEDPANFYFGDEEFVWKGLRVATSGIEEIRHHVTSFGSCSFDEPRKDLRRLHLL
jgi:hypothetical protein